MATLLSSKPVVSHIRESLVGRIYVMRERGVVPTLAIVRVGDRPDDVSYEASVVKRLIRIGIDVRRIIFSENVSTEGLMAGIRELNHDPTVHGVLLFRPMPKHIDETAVCEVLDYNKDMDGVTEASLGGIFSQSGKGYPPCTAQACVEMLKYYSPDLAGKNVVIVGRSNVVGKPLSMLLLQQNATVTICHTKTADLPSITKSADILIAAAGRANLITAEHVSPGQTVIDVGVNMLPDGKMVGDTAFDEVEPIVHAITPVPGGVGPVTTSVLAQHVVTAAEKSSK